MLRIIGFVLTLLFLVTSRLPAQPVYYDTYGPIVISSLDRVISEARNAASREGDPDLEFELVKVYLTDYVNGNRQSSAQDIQFSSPDRFNTWLKDVARRIERPEAELRSEIVNSFAPNRCPDLIGYASDARGYYTDIARQNLRDKRESEIGPPIIDMVPTPQPPPKPARYDTSILEYAPSATRSQGNAPRTLRSAATTTATEIMIEFSPPASTPAAKAPAKPTKTPVKKSSR